MNKLMAAICLVVVSLSTTAEPIKVSVGNKSMIPHLVDECKLAGGAPGVLLTDGSVHLVLMVQRNSLDEDIMTLLGIAHQNISTLSTDYIKEYNCLTVEKN